MATARRVGTSGRKAASSRRTSRCLRHRHFQSSRSCSSANEHPETMKMGGRLARGRGSVTLPYAGRACPERSEGMPARLRAGRPPYDFQSSHSCPSADGHPETMKCHSERSEESCSASDGPPEKNQGEIPRFARNDSAFQCRMTATGFHFQGRAAGP
jgi:hypothetical protein